MRFRFFFGLLVGAATSLYGQHPPGQQGSSNVHIATHIPMPSATDIKVEQEASRPYVYVSVGGPGGAGFDVISIKNPERANTIYKWRIDHPELHQGGGTGAMYFKIKGRYYVVQSVQFRPTGPDADVGGIVLDVTGLPDTTKVKEVARIRVPEHPGGFHESFAYKHSDGRALFVTTVVAPFARIYDMEKVIAGQPGVVGEVPLPGEPYKNAGQNELTQLLQTALPGYHDFYVGYDAATHQDKLYGAGAGGYYLWDITKPETPKLLTSITGVAGVPFGHTFTPDPTGRYAVTETEYQYAPLRLFDLKPGLDGTVQTISRPIGAWTVNWKNLVHNHEVRWPYVFVSAYKDGMYVFNMMDPTNPYTVGYYDSFDAPDEMGQANAGVLGSMGGTFGVDVRNSDGLIVTSGRTGYWSFYMDGFTGWNGHQWGMPNISSAQDWDNGPDGAPKQKVS
jgi:hypothetical protein